MVVLPKKCQQYLAQRGVAYDQLEEGGQRAIILRGFKLPQGKYDATQADVLIILPASYPDSAPDMFYATPWLRLATTNTYPRAANHPVEFNGVKWQRWSRHNSEWRRGIDGIWSMVKRIEEALEIAE